MKYKEIEIGTFLERPNRFIAYVEIQGKKETVHVKNTGRCRELFYPGAPVYVQKAENPERKTAWDLIAVEKGDQIVNVDSQVPNQVVREWIASGHLFQNVSEIRPETVYGNSRFDFYVETGEGRRIFLEIKGVTLEEDGIAAFPDAPSDRAVKHVNELIRAVEEGYEAYVLFVIQMKRVRFLTPNTKTHPAFAEALQRAKEKGVHLLAYDCRVKKDAITIGKEIPVVLPEVRLKQLAAPLVEWFRKEKRDLPWRKDTTAYRVWVSEIMLQQTRVEAVKPYYNRFMKELPDVKALAGAGEDRLLKLWEGLGYYNRIRNMQKAAVQIEEEYGGKFPERYEDILRLTGIGSYTAGAIASFAYGIPKPAVDGNVLRVLARILGIWDDVLKAETKAGMEQLLELVIPPDAASDFNQGLIELGAVICLPNGEPKCSVCPVRDFCRAREEGWQEEIPIRRKQKSRRIEHRTIFVFRDGGMVAIRKRPAKGLLAGMYELPSVEGTLSQEEAVAYAKSIGLLPVRIVPMGEARHVFSHIEWQMTGYAVYVDELEKSCTEPMLFISPREIQDAYPIPSAFEAYRKYL
ncbi:MAG TPA: sugar fermentation stimulation protein SfsA [Lachnospiraceae bacterium]|nr:sugar fermentation stimulation protein SfsA [Lachnospiraceae bacterium]